MTRIVRIVADNYAPDPGTDDAPWPEVLDTAAIGLDPTQFSVDFTPDGPTVLDCHDPQITDADLRALVDAIEAAWPVAVQAVYRMQEATL